MEEKTKRGYIIPYAPIVDGNMIGDIRGNLTGLPLFLLERQQKSEWEKEKDAADANR